MATAVSLTAEQANKVDLAVTKVIGSIRQNIDDLGGWMKAALFDQVASDLRKGGFDDDTADHLNRAADAIRGELRAEDRAVHGREVRS